VIGLLTALRKNTENLRLANQVAPHIRNLRVTPFIPGMANLG
jgi:hypothetical protein